nr:uncharacterized protein LOC123762735 [Procambarus clarkii]
MATVSQVGGGSFLPLHQPLLQLPMTSPRAPGPTTTPTLQHLPNTRFTMNQLHHLFSQYQNSYNPASQRQQRWHSTTTTTTAPRPTAAVHHQERRTEGPRFVSQFHYGDNYGVRPAEDDAIVLLVGLFNLLAVVVYAASKYVKGQPGELSDRVIHWQVQKVLDELVIKVHSSQYAANLLSRAMPDAAAGRQEAGRTAAPRWPQLLQAKMEWMVEHNTTRWLQEAKERLVTEIGSSPAALDTVLLHPRIYKPLQELYATLATDGGLTSVLQQLRAGGEEPRGLSSLLTTVSKLSLAQLQSALATLTALGRAQQRVNVVPVVASAVRDSLASQTSAGEGRAASEADHYMSEALLQLLRRSKTSPGQESRPAPAVSRRRQYNSRYSGVHEHDAPEGNQRQVVKRQGLVEDEHSLGGKPSGHWTDRWFSLVTQVSPVGLDMTTLYARARARPTCLRALLCRANNAWRQVGPVQASLTPFTSVVVSWVLEDVAPHSLGDSLIAVRAGWMGKDCSQLYPECPLHPDPHPATKEAITFFSRLQFAATQSPDQSEHSEGQLSQDQTMTTLTKRIDAPEIQDFGIQKNTPWPPYPSQRQEFHVTPTPQTQHQPQDLPLAPNSSRPAHNYWPTETEPQHSQGSESNDNDAAASFHAYYERYGGQGPMSVPGSQYSSKYGQLDRENGGKNSEELYDKYDSPVSSSVEGAISNSSSVSGMALQDPPTGTSPKVWEKLFKAGLYGTSVPQAQTSDHKESSSDESNTIKSSLRQHPQRRQSMQPTSSLNKMGALLPQQFPHNSDKNNHGHLKYSQQGRPARPFFSLRPTQKHQQATRAPPSSPPSTQAPPIKKYKYGLRRGLPAGNVNGHNAYMSNNNLHQRHKSWYTYNTNTRYQPTPPTTSSTTTSTTIHPLKLKDVAPFGPEDAVTDVLRNELLFEYIRDRKISIPSNDKRSIS